MEGILKQESLEEIARLKKENEILRAENSKLKEKIEVQEEAHGLVLDQLVETKQDAHFDNLTGLQRKELFIQRISEYLDNGEEPSNLETEHRRNEIEMPVVSMVVFDIDKFKNINDTLGHNAGDVILKAVSETIQRYTRNKDVTARWGGEEIVLAMIGANEEAAMRKADFIREKISQLEFSEFPNLKVTVSAGVASSSEHNKFDDLFNAADEAMYISKNNGRNQVTAHKAI